jgi:hypothetical protein
MLGEAIRESTTVLWVPQWWVAVFVGFLSVRCVFVLWKAYRDLMT